MMDKKFTTVDNVFSERTLKMLSKYCDILPTDLSSYDVWPTEITNYNQLPECFTNTLYGADKMVVLDELFNSKLPCAGKKWLKDSDIAIQKIVPGGNIAKHYDYCQFSLTVFLSEPAGGEFVWWDKNGKATYTVAPGFNKGVYAFYETGSQEGAAHKVKTVHNNTRYTLQLFVFDKHNVTGARYPDSEENDEKED